MTSPTTTTDMHRETRVDVRLKHALKQQTLPRDLLICGPAGTGKTYAVLMFLHRLAREHSDLRVLICRQTRASLTDSVLATLEYEVLPRHGGARLAQGTLRHVRRSYRYPNGSELVLRGLDTPTSVFSTAWDIIYVNEAIETTEDAWESLASRLNRPGRDPRFGFLIGDTNPGGPSHWLKLRGDRGVTTFWDGIL